MENAERAVTVAAEATGAVVSEYTAGPRYMTLHGRGAHEWIVEFGRAPESFDAFVQKLDGRTDAAQLRLRGQTPQYDGAAESMSFRRVRSPAGCFGAAKTRFRALPTTAGCWRMCWRRRPDRMRR